MIKNYNSFFLNKKVITILKKNINKEDPLENKNSVSNMNLSKITPKIINMKFVTMKVTNIDKYFIFST